MSNYIARILLLLVLPLVTLMAIEPVTAQETAPKGTLTGQVVNGTAGGDVPGGLEVTLWVLQNGERVDSQAVVTNEQGHFSLDNLETSAGWSYLLRTTYQEVTYSQGPLQFEAGQDLLVTMLPVYETTTNNARIVVERAHLIFSEQEQALAVAELYVFANAGDRTYIGQEELDGKRWTSRFALPETIHNLSFSDGSLGARFMATEDGFVDREPIWPGRTSVMFRYILDANGGTYNLARALAYPIMRMNVLIPDTGLTVESQDLQLQDKLAAQGEEYWNYVASNLAAGHRLELTLRAASSGATRAGQGLAQIWQTGLLLLGGGAVVVALAYPFWQQRQAARSRRKAGQA